MTDSSNSTVYGSVAAVLQGGPPGFPERLRRHQVTADQEKVKVQYLGGYEHFERVIGDDHAINPCAPVVYKWTMRTKIAE
jgi:Family of unknown function (DUF5988)